MANDSPTSKILSVEQLKRDTSTVFQYPSDLASIKESKYTFFRIYTYSKQSVNTVETVDLLGTILLPIPPELSSTDVLNYKEFTTPVSSPLVDAINANNIEGALSALGVAATAGIAGLLNKSSIGKGIVNQSAVMGGVSVNPRNTNIFETPNAREYKFTFKMVAKSLEESNSIRTIVNKFRYHAYQSTTLDDSVFIAPDLFHISFNTGSNDDSYLFKPLPSALTSITVNYNGSSTPTFFAGSGAPVEVTMILTFKEMELDTKEKLLERYYPYLNSTGDITVDNTPIPQRPDMKLATNSDPFNLNTSINIFDQYNIPTNMSKGISAPIPKEIKR